MKLSDTGGQTEFCNTYAAYEDLPETDKEALPIFGWSTVPSARSTM